MTPLAERFATKYVVDADTGCWNWTATRHGAGYGTIREGRRGSRALMAHRVSYEIHVGPIPDGLQIDHLCRNRGCVNPAHLEPVTSRENTMRGSTLPAANVQKTHCNHGHPYSGPNLLKLPNGERRCRSCSKVARRRYYARTGR